MDFCRKIILLLIFSSFMSVGWGQDCIEGVEVELWGECYNIEETISLNLSNQELNEQIPPEIGNLENLTMLDLSNVGLNGQIPPEIGNLENLTIVDLGHNQLTGQIPIQIGNLTNLEYLGFNHNELLGEIPSEIGNLTNLTHIRLNYNQLIGEIPSEIGNLVNLEILKFYNNQFTFVSDSICNLTNLYWSSGNYGNYDSNIYNNNLCPPYPSCIEDYVGYQNTSECEEPSLCDEEIEVELWGVCYNIEETTILELSNSGISGEIPPEIGDLINLTYLNLFSNQLTGEIPVEIGNLTNLTILGLMSNQLTGEIPHEIGNLINLTYLNLFSNQLTGEIPVEIGNLMNLTILDLLWNQLTGNIPSEIGNLVNLIILRLNDNNLSGEIPGNICDLTIDWSGVSEIYQLPYFNVDNNNLCPPYPDCLINQEPYTDLNGNDIWDEGEPFEDTNENGIYEEDCVGDQDTSECSICDEGYTEIDGECYYQSDLDVLQDFIDNSQGGDNPPPSDLSPIELCGQVWFDGRLVNLYCSGDNLEQDESYIDFELDIPESIGNLTSLMSFGLEYNNLSSLPESIGNLTNLLGLLLHHNQLTSLPESIGNLTNLTGLDVDNNQLTSLPESIGNLTNLTRLLLPVNQLTSLPESIGNLTNLTDLYLFSNNLTSIPESIGNLSSLELLWLQNNQLTSLPESICNLVENNCSIFLQDNEICPPYPSCIEDYVGYQDISECEEDPQIGDECVTQDGWIGFYDCELCCWDEWIIENWLGDGWCDYLGGCGFEGPLFNCPELGYDCGDCSEDWDGTDSSGLCSDDCLFSGDVNNDSSLNILDLVSISNLILDDDYNQCGDTNSDGELNILDLVTLVNVILDN